MSDDTPDIADRDFVVLRGCKNVLIIDSSQVNVQNCNEVALTNSYNVHLAGLHLLSLKDCLLGTKFLSQMDPKDEP